MTSPRRYKSPCSSFEDEKMCDTQQNCIWFNNRCRDKRFKGDENFLNKDVWSVVQSYTYDPEDLKQTYYQDFEEFPTMTITNNMLEQAIDLRDMELIEDILFLNKQYGVGMLRIAAKKGDRVMVERMIQLGAGYFDVDLHHALHDIALSDAAEKGHMDIIERMIQLGADINYGLHGAAYAGNMDIVERMIQLGANDFQPAINIAVEVGHMDIVELLIDKGVDINYGLYVAVEAGDMDMVELFIELGANDFEELIFYAARGGYMDIVELLIDEGADINVGLYGAVRGDEMDMVELLINQGANDFQQAINIATEEGYMDIVQRLIFLRDNL